MQVSEDPGKPRPALLPPNAMRYSPSVRSGPPKPFMFTLCSNLCKGIFKKQKNAKETYQKPVFSGLMLLN